MAEIDHLQARLCGPPDCLVFARRQDPYIQTLAREVADLLPTSLGLEMRAIPVRSVFRRDLNAEAVLFPSGARGILLHIGTSAVLYNLAQNLMRAGEEEWDEHRGYNAFLPLAQYVVDPFSLPLPSLPGGALEQLFGAFSSEYLKKFILAHEFFHLICNHHSHRPDYAVQDELEADVRAIDLVGAITSKEPEIFLAHLDALFSFLQLCERLAPPQGPERTHPSAAARRQQVRAYCRSRFPDTAESGEQIEDIFEAMWEIHRQKTR